MNTYEKRLLAAPLALVVLFFIAQISLQADLESKGHGDVLETIGVPLDDVYIHCRYAENLLEGNGYCFNPGATVTADTSPLWVLLIAFGGLATSHLEVVAVILSLLFYAILVVAAYRLSRLLGVGEFWSQAIATLTAVSGRLLWSALSGMEVTLACVLVVGVFLAYLSGRSRLTALLLALGVATRPELWLLVAIIFADLFVRLVKKEVLVAEVGLSATIFVVYALPVLLLPYVERGSLVFHSSVVQGAALSPIPDWGYLWFSSKILFATVMPPFVLGLCGVYYFRNDVRFRLIGAFAFGLPILLAFVAPQFRHHGRYFFPVIPLLIVLGIAGVAKFVERWSAGETEKRVRIKYKVAFYALFLAAGIIFIRWYTIYRGAIANITEQHVTAAEWIERHATPDDVVASHDVGAIGYLTKRRVIDLVGLVTPEVFPLMHDQRQVWQYARAHGANIFVIYNRLNPSFYEYAKDSLALQASLRVDPLVSSADTVLSIYRVKQSGTH